MDQSKEKFAQLQELIESHKNMKGALMPILQGAQGIFGCVSEDVQKFIAEGLGVPLSEVYGVATFYAQFSLHPKESISSTFVWVLHAMSREARLFLTSSRKCWKFRSEEPLRMESLHWKPQDVLVHAAWLLS